MERSFIFQAAIFMLVIMVMGPECVHGRCSSLPYPHIFLNCCIPLEAEYVLTAEEISSFCLQNYLIKTPYERWQPNNPFKSRKGHYFVKNILKRPFSYHYRRKRQAMAGHDHGTTSIYGCTRKEIRDLSPSELAVFHKVIRAASDEAWNPSNSRESGYEFFAKWHSGTEIQNVHGGPAFLPWHRVYLYALEAYLKTFDSSFCLPYWDSGFEYKMVFPLESTLFGYDYVGFYFPSRYQKFWVTRYFNGQRDLLFSEEKIQNILKQNDYKRVVYDQNYHRLDPENAGTIEIAHNDVHVYVGGNMASLDMAPLDVLFFLHHCNVDRVWQLYKDSHRDKTYPFGTGAHAEHATMPSFEEINFGDIPGLPEKITNKFGDSDFFDNMITYAPSPNKCTDGFCGAGNQIMCTNGDCVPMKREIYFDDYYYRKKRSAPGFVHLPPPTFPTIIQHNYFLDGKYDKKLWVYLPILITYMRPSDLHFESYFPNKGKVSHGHDMFDTCSYSNLYRKMKVGHQKHFKHCNKETSAMIVYVQSVGKNYKGEFLEYAVIDQRYTITNSIAYVGIKRPTSCGIEVFLSAYDECGRICKPMCLVEGSNPPKYKHCTGILRIDNREPILYKDTVDKDFSQHWDWPDPRLHMSPTATQRGFSINFLCDSANQHFWQIDKDTY